VRYHFPKKYRNQISTGDLFIYHQGDKSNIKNRFYFGMGVIGRITPTEDEEHYYAKIVNGKSFDVRVPIYHDEEKYYELIENDGIQKNSLQLGSGRLDIYQKKHMKLYLELLE